MKAAVLRGAKDIRTETVPDPVCAPHGVIVKVNSCGVCGSDLHWYKEDGHEGTIFGHEFSGDIVEVGKNVGDRRRHALHGRRLFSVRPMLLVQAGKGAPLLGHGAFGLSVSRRDG